MASAILFLYLVLPAHALSSKAYGLFAALFGIVVLLGAVFTAAQTWVAGAIARVDSDERGLVIRQLARRLCPALVALLILCAVSTPALSAGLRAPLGTVALVAVLAILTFVFACVIGVLQGEERFVILGALNAVQALLRLGALVITLPTGNINAILIATVLSMVPVVVLAGIVARVLRRPKPGVSAASVLPIGGMGLTLLVAFVVGFPTIGDVIVVRMSHSAADAGAFAIAALVGRVVLFFAITLNALAYPHFIRNPQAALQIRLLGRVCGASLLVALPLLAVSLWAPSVLDVLITGSVTSLPRMLMPMYISAATLFALASSVAYLHLARMNRAYLLGVLVPVLVALVACCALVHPISSLVVCLNVLGGLFLSAGAYCARRMLVEPNRMAKP